MKPKSVWRREGNHLVPANADARDALYAITNGHTCVADTWVAQHPEQLARYWILIGIVAEAVGLEKNRLSDLLQIKLKRYNVSFDATGRMRIEVHSLSTEAMDAVDFEAFMRLAIVALAEMIGSAEKDLRREFLAASKHHL